VQLRVELHGISIILIVLQFNIQEDFDMSAKAAVLVPCFNEEVNIPSVVATLKRHVPEMDIIIINDCSTDHTAAVAAAAGVKTVLDLPCNLGIGGAVQTGLKYAHRNGYELAIKFDGDGQHKAENICKLLAPIEANEADVVIGSRFCAKHDGFKSTFFRRMGIRLFFLVNSALIRQMITDNTSGFRAYNRRALSFLAKRYPSFDYPEPEEVILLGKNQFRIKEVFTEMNPRLGGVSSISPMKSVYYMIKVMFAICMVAMRPPVKQEKR
jgi:glycosyltransferase involved in cell wall biosynthesis